MRTPNATLDMVCPTCGAGLGKLHFYVDGNMVPFCLNMLIECVDGKHFIKSIENGVTSPVLMYAEAE